MTAPKSKPVVTPSYLTSYTACKLAFSTRYLKGLTAAAPLSVPPTLGTLIHVGEAAVDTSDDPKQAIAARIAEYKHSPTYLVRDHALLKKLGDEAEWIVLGHTWPKGSAIGYAAWLTKHSLRPLEGWTERRARMDLGAVVVTPRVDTVVQDDTGGLWVLERKSTSRDDPSWKRKWALDGQTTMQLMAVRGIVGGDVRGILIEQILYGRARTEGGLPGRILRVARPEPRRVRKASDTLTLYTARLEAFANDIRTRHEWPADGMDTGACARCEFNAQCRGELPWSQLKRSIARPETTMNRRLS